MSTCNDDCAKMWMPFYVEDLTLPESLNPSNFATIERADGSKQTTFKSWPLYLYSRGQFTRRCSREWPGG